MTPTNRTGRGLLTLLAPLGLALLLASPAAAWAQVAPGSQRPAWPGGPRPFVASPALWVMDASGHDLLRTGKPEPPPAPQQVATVRGGSASGWMVLTFSVLTYGSAGYVTGLIAENAFGISRWGYTGLGLALATANTVFVCSRQRCRW